MFFLMRSDVSLFCAAVPASKAVPKVVVLGAGPPADPASLVHADVLKLFFTDAGKQNVKAFKGVVTEYSVIDSLDWRVLNPALHPLCNEGETCAVMICSGLWQGAGPTLLLRFVWRSFRAWSNAS